MSRERPRVAGIHRGPWRDRNGPPAAASTIGGEAAAAGLSRRLLAVQRQDPGGSETTRAATELGCGRGLEVIDETVGQPRDVGADLPLHEQAVHPFD